MARCGPRRGVLRPTRTIGLRRGLPAARHDSMSAGLGRAAANCQGDLRVEEEVHDRREEEDCAQPYAPFSHPATSRGELAVSGAPIDPCSHRGTSIGRQAQGLKPLGLEQVPFSTQDSIPRRALFAVRRFLAACRASYLRNRKAMPPSSDLTSPTHPSETATPAGPRCCTDCSRDYRPRRSGRRRGS